MIFYLPSFSILHFSLVLLSTHHIFMLIRLVYFTLYGFFIFYASQPTFRFCFNIRCCHWTQFNWWHWSSWTPSNTRLLGDAPIRKGKGTIELCKPTIQHTCTPKKKKTKKKRKWWWGETKNEIKKKAEKFLSATFFRCCILLQIEKKFHYV